MIKNKPAFLLLVLLMAIAIIAIIVFATGGFSNMWGSKNTAGTVNYQLNDMEKKVNDYNQRGQNALDGN